MSLSLLGVGLRDSGSDGLITRDCEDSGGDADSLLLDVFCTRFSFARRFWNQIFTCSSFIFNCFDISMRYGRGGYFVLLKNFSNSCNWLMVKAVRWRLNLPVPVIER